jgi:hypothetical protein
MELINVASEAESEEGGFRPRGFRLHALSIGDKDALVGSKVQKKVKNGDVVIYVDQEGLLLKSWDEDECEEDVTFMYKNMRLFREVAKGSGSECQVLEHPSCRAGQYICIKRHGED